ncbi:6-N-hydroxylaminopurine resistance protein [Aquisphaera giovannonii]|uniref:6-N-hydroxylaminopurine resistance protein n=1 Tax=Aquisphaera giovannonii TaxID=406548 RepID=A0A5B9W1X6_9BACT|nr:MOSC domain-containing protein [Aquisphaera giovannonii]QEH34553.1 6-N-hydroxylaminopurine resistance protein [Aquisphaera giovannonii]
MTAPMLVSIQVGRPRELDADLPRGPGQGPWTSGFLKSPAAGPVLARATNLDGDGQADLENHGGPDKAVCVYSADHLDYWIGRLGLPAMPFGAFGENFSLRGLAEPQVCIGDVWEVGSAVFQVSQPRQPCWKLARRWRVKTLAAQVQQTGFIGWYFRLLAEGVVEAGQPMRLADRPCPEWTVERANRVMHIDRDDHRLAAELAALPPLAASWRRQLGDRAATAAAGPA